jgi:hypothetical protein
MGRLQWRRPGGAGDRTTVLPSKKNPQQNPVGGTQIQAGRVGRYVKTARPAARRARTVGQKRHALGPESKR